MRRPKPPSPTPPNVCENIGHDYRQLETIEVTADLIIFCTRCAQVKRIQAVERIVVVRAPKTTA